MIITALHDPVVQYGEGMSRYEQVREYPVYTRLVLHCSMVVCTTRYLALEPQKFSQCILTLILG
jgi:hypothetical protein